MAGVGIKIDREKERAWRKHLELWGESGQSIGAYCRGAGIAEHQFYYWRERIKRLKIERKGISPTLQEGSNSAGGKTSQENRTTEIKSATFVEVSAEALRARQSSAAIVMVHPSGWRIEVCCGCEAGMLRDVVGVIAGMQ